MGGCHGEGDCKHTAIFLTIKRTSTQHRSHGRHAPAAGHSGGIFKAASPETPNYHWRSTSLSIPLPEHHKRTRILRERLPPLYGSSRLHLQEHKCAHCQRKFLSTNVQHFEDLLCMDIHHTSHLWNCFF